ncbi:uncharacterized protein LOC114536568 [Dendronephthya gigantea]|uniref:uncharacterized protein LOC114536568 n=1 Tax=Dendronephthya gigantea TaxID=151771 RepID=UPI00106C5DB9|nr:uncharacterized protein LOC114536568 [Dendronephthya gigantea]
MSSMTVTATPATQSSEQNLTTFTREEKATVLNTRNEFTATATTPSTTGGSGPISIAMASLTLTAAPATQSLRQNLIFITFTMEENATVFITRNELFGSPIRPSTTVGSGPIPIAMASLTLQKSPATKPQTPHTSEGKTAVLSTSKELGLVNM